MLYQKADNNFHVAFGKLGCWEAEGERLGVKCLLLFEAGSLFCCWLLCMLGQLALSLGDSPATASHLSVGRLGLQM